MPVEISFRDFDETDIHLLKQWLSMPHVKEYWQEDEDGLREKFPGDLRKRGVSPFIVMIDGRPVGYIQYYEACNIGGGWWPNMRSGVFGIDQFIGEPDMIGRGIGTAVIKSMIGCIFSCTHADEIIADPHPKNVRAIRAYERSGFYKDTEIDTPGGRALLMRIRKQAI